MLTTLKYTIFGLKLAKREPIIGTAKGFEGQVIDDGVNRPISLCSSDNEQVVDAFLASIRERIHGKSWKTWKQVNEVDVETKVLS